MANIVNTQILEDGRENTIIRVTGEINTANLAFTVIADPATLSDMGPYAGLKAVNLRVKKISFDIEETLVFQLFWDATTPLLFDELVEEGVKDYRDCGGLQNNAGAGKTGKITMSSEGFAAGAQNFAITFYLGKQDH